MKCSIEEPGTVLLLDGDEDIGLHLGNWIGSMEQEVSHLAHYG